MSKSRIVSVIVLVLALGACVQADRWMPPALPAADAQLPRLALPVVLDGDVIEWAAAACVPVRSFADVTSLSHLHQWRGASDAAVEVYCAWNEKGLCLAAVVADDDVVASSDTTKLWERDCVEFFVDGRSGDKFMREPYSPGAYQILIRPPTAQAPVLAVLNPRDGKVEGLEVAGKRTKTGYTIELVVPWSAFPEFSPREGAAIAFQFSLNEYDGRDGRLVHPLILSRHGAADLWARPDRFIRWALTDRIRTGADVPIGPLAALDVAAMHAAEKPMPISVEVGKLLSGITGSFQVRVSDSAGKTLFERRVRAMPVGAPWMGSVRARTELAPKPTSDGYLTISVVLNDKRGKPIGTLRESSLFLGNAVASAIARIQKADVARLAQTQPFKAAAYLGAAACVEKLKRAIELGKAAETIRAVHEIEARLAVLERGSVGGEGIGLLGLLDLTADPESQVVVEYPEERRASVMIECGAVPVVFATVERFDSPDQAQARLAELKDRPGHAIASGGRLITAWSPSDAAAQRFAELIAAGKSIAPSEAGVITAEAVKCLGRGSPAADLPAGSNVFCGDLHAHTFYSDGTPSPVGLMLEAMYCGMDFAAITDHNTIQGALLAGRLLERHGVAFPLAVGEEITTEWSHFNAYPLREPISEKLTMQEMVKAAHAQGAVIQWNHPTAVPSEWTTAHLAGIKGTGLDAWEHIPPEYDAWKNAGKLPTLTGTTDTHDGTFAYPERTVILAPSPLPQDVAEAVRRGRTVVISGMGDRIIYGSDEMIAAASSLADGRLLKAAKAERLKKLLSRADVAGLLRASQPRP